MRSVLMSTVLLFAISIGLCACRGERSTSSRTSAETALFQILKTLKRSYAETGRYPIGTAALTPPRSCCEYPQARCADLDLFAKDPVWKALDFKPDPPSLFRFSYYGSDDGQSFAASAVGDLDCDGFEVTYLLSGEATKDKPQYRLDPPMEPD